MKLIDSVKAGAFPLKIGEFALEIQRVNLGIDGMRRNGREILGQCQLFRLRDSELGGCCGPNVEGRCKATWKRESKLPWREAAPLNHYDDGVDSGQYAVKK